MLEHSALYRIAFQRVAPGLTAGPELTEARERAFAQLLRKVGRLERAGLLGSKTVREASVEFNAMLEGLSNAELRGGVLSILPPDEAERERTWREALTTVVRGFSGKLVRSAKRSPPR